MIYTSKKTACAPMTLDDLPILPRDISVHEFSSHNKQNLNGDCGWVLYEDENGDSVVFDATGPGCIRSFWNTCIMEGEGDTQILKFYFDGEQEPRYSIRLIDLYDGKHPDFPAPLTERIVTGHFDGDQRCGNCFVPIPFEKSLKISVQGPPNFFHFFYERYPYGTPVTTFTGKEDRSYLLNAFENMGEELQPVSDAEVITTAGNCPYPNEEIELLNIEKAATIKKIVIESENAEDILNQVEIQMRWDDSIRPNVQAPIGMFFGSAIRGVNLRSLPAKVEKLPSGRIRMTCYFRMPFWRKACIMLTNRMIRQSGPFTTEVHLVPNDYEEESTGHFSALYRDGRTEMARDWLFCDAQGTGWFVGAVQTSHGGHYCEGDEHFIIDGTGMPQINGTGTEDYYLSCFWPNYNYNLPFAGCVEDITVTPGPACYYRFHIEAPIPFYQSLDARIQHGANSNIISHYRTLGFYYIKQRPVIRLTDFIDVASELNEAAHGYKATDSQLTGALETAYEGNAAWTFIRDEGRTHNGGEIEFTAAIDPNNSGVRLRRRLDQNIPCQSADIFVDGASAGTWYHANGNTYLRWFDSEYDLPAELTKGKKSINIRLVVKSEKGYGPYTDFRYEIFSYE